MSTSFSRPTAAAILQGKPVFARPKKNPTNVVENRLRRELIAQAGYAHPAPPPFAVGNLDFEFIESKKQFLGGSQELLWKLTLKPTATFILAFAQTEAGHVVQKEAIAFLFSNNDPFLNPHV